MWHWMRHLGGWAMRKLPLRVRARMHRHGLFFSYEKAGLVLAGWPIPPNADCVLIEAVLRLPISARRKEEFSLIVGSGTPVHPETLRHDEHDDHFHLFFRIPTPTENSMANLIWRNHSLGQLQLPVVGVDQIINTVKLQSPTLFVRVGTQNVACRSFVSTQCRGLLAAAVLTSEVPLASLVDLGLRAEFVNETSNQQYVVPVQLSSSQLACRQTMVTAEPPKVPRRVGVWSVRWKLGERLLHTHHLRAIGNTTFQRSLRMTDARFVVEPIDGPIYVRRQVPNLNECRRVGPCFLLASTQEGIAGLCHLEVVACVPGSMQMPVLLAQDLLITDGPTVFAPGTIDAAELAQVNAFELRLNGRSLGSLPLRPVPQATFTSEGGFIPPGEFVWTSAAEEELNERLARLMQTSD
jgi:hypothetical protein